MYVRRTERSTAESRSSPRDTIEPSSTWNYADQGESLMVTVKEQFTAQGSPELLASLRAIAHSEGRDFEATLENAMRRYVECKTGSEVQPDAVAHFRSSLERKRRLYELLAQWRGGF